MQGVRMHTSICTQWCWQALLLPSQHWCEVMVVSSVTDLGFASYINYSHIDCLLTLHHGYE